MTNDNSHHHRDMLLDEGLVTSLAVPFWTQPGFAIPLVRSRADSNVAYVQRVGRNQRIVGFELFEGSSNIVPVSEPKEVRVGEKELFALIDPNGEPHTGPRNKLAPIVRQWVGHIDTPLVRMNFARFCGNDALATRSAAEAVRSKSLELKSKDDAILWFVDAVLIIELLNVLAGARNAKSLQIEDELLGNSLLSVQLDKDRLSIELPAFLLDQKAGAVKGFKLEKLLRFARQATGRGLDLKKKVQAGRTKSSREKETEHLRSISENIRQLSTQEKRLARLIRSLVIEPLGPKLLEHYSDKTVFMKKALLLLREALAPWPAKKQLDQKIAAVLLNIISTSYPRQKGRLLLQLARELNEFEHISAVIRNIATHSKSQDVIPLRDSIVEVLSLGFENRR
ncbi:hypothetical protein [Bradyrhizobium sp. P5_C12]